MIPSSDLFEQSTIQQLLDLDLVVADYRTFFSFLDWSLVDLWQDDRSSRGRPAHVESAYLKLFFIHIREGFRSITQLRRFLLKHPLLVLDLGFHLLLDRSATYGFDCHATLPSEVYLRKKLRCLDQALLQALLHATVRDLREEIPGLGETVAFDVKHIYAWVRENNPRLFIKDRFDKQKQPKGDPDCKVGVKRSTNFEQPDGSKKEKKELLWGYGSGVAAATTPDYGDVVLAEYTQPFSCHDITHFNPLHQQAATALERFPTHLTADAAYDAWYVYEPAARQGGIGAIPLNQRGTPPAVRDADGVPRCPRDLRMIPLYQFDHTSGYRAQHFGCPLLFPQATEQTCNHEQFIKGKKGCVKDLNWELGGRMRVLLDRDSPLYKAIYNQRTSCERINSQAQELGIERPKVRNIRSVKNLNTLTYLIINVRALERVKSINKGLLQMN